MNKSQDILIDQIIDTLKSNHCHAKATGKADIVKWAKQT